MSKRFKNANWDIASPPDKPDSALNCHEAALAVMMDIRDELQALNAKCWRLSSLETQLRGLRRDVKSKKRCHKKHVEAAQ